MEEIIAKSKAFKAEKQRQREEDQDETSALDDQFRCAQGWGGACPPAFLPRARPPTASHTLCVPLSDAPACAPVNQPAWQPAVIPLRTPNALRPARLPNPLQDAAGTEGAGGAHAQERSEAVSVCAGTEAHGAAAG